MKEVLNKSELLNIKDENEGTMKLSILSKNAKKQRDFASTSL